MIRRTRMELRRGIVRLLKRIVVVIKLVAVLDAVAASANQLVLENSSSAPIAAMQNIDAGKHEAGRAAKIIAARR